MKKVIETKNLNKVFGEGDLAIKALNDVNFHIEEGEFTALVGPSSLPKKKSA